MIENPSKDKFGPPPPHRDPMARTPIYKRWWFTAAVAAAWIAHFWLRSQRRQGWQAFASFALILGLGIVKYFSNRAAENDDDPGPYSPPSDVTR